MRVLVDVCWSAAVCKGLLHRQITSVRTIFRVWGEEGKSNVEPLLGNRVSHRPFAKTQTSANQVGTLDIHDTPADNPVEHEGAGGSMKQETRTPPSRLRKTAARVKQCGRVSPPKEQEHPRPPPAECETQKPRWGQEQLHRARQQLSVQRVLKVSVQPPGSLKSISTLMPPSGLSPSLCHS